MDTSGRDVEGCGVLDGGTDVRGCDVVAEGRDVERCKTAHSHRLSLLAGIVSHPMSVRDCPQVSEKSSYCATHVKLPPCCVAQNVLQLTIDPANWISAMHGRAGERCEFDPSQTTPLSTWFHSVGSHVAAGGLAEVVNVDAGAEKGIGDVLVPH